MKSTPKYHKKAAKKGSNALIITTAIVALILAIIALTPVSDRSGAPAISNIVVGSPAPLDIVSSGAGPIEVGQIQSIDWTAGNYPAQTVNVNLIRKVSDNPARYVLVRRIALKTQNDGSATWVPASTDVGSGLSIEVGCTLSADACHAADSYSALAVVDTGRFANTASAYLAIENWNNR